MTPRAQAHVPFVSRVRQRLGDYPPMERRLAEFILDFPGDLASYSASELAGLARVSNATVTRFIRRIGYSTYDTARRHVRAEQESGSPLLLARRGHTDAGLLESRLGVHQRNLQRTLERIADSDVESIAKAILASRKTWITGFRSSRALAGYLRWQLFQFKEDTLIFPAEGDTVGQSVASMAAADVVIVFGLRRRVRGLKALLMLAAESGAAVLYISDDKAPSVESLAWHWRCVCSADSPLDDHVAVMAVCHLLASRVLALAGPAQRDRLTAIEGAHLAMNEL